MRAGVPKSSLVRPRKSCRAMRASSSAECNSLLAARAPRASNAPAAPAVKNPLREVMWNLLLVREYTTAGNRMAEPGGKRREAVRAKAARIYALAALRRAAIRGSRLLGLSRLKDRA